MKKDCRNSPFPPANALCDFCSSDQRFACIFLQIPPRDGHPWCSAVSFPLPGRIEDLHPLETCTARRTIKKWGRFCPHFLNLILLSAFQTFFTTLLFPASSNRLAQYIYRNHRRTQNHNRNPSGDSKRYTAEHISNPCKQRERNQRCIHD